MHIATSKAETEKVLLQISLFAFYSLQESYFSANIQM